MKLCVTVTVISIEFCSDSNVNQRPHANHGMRRISWDIKIKEIVEPIRAMIFTVSIQFLGGEFLSKHFIYQDKILLVKRSSAR